MARSVVWADLLSVYCNATWLSDQDAEVSVISAEMVETFQLVENSDRAAADANLAALVDPNTIRIGQKVRARIGPPRLAIGVLADTWDGLIDSPDGKITEPPAYFVKEDGTHSGSAPVPQKLLAYRSMVELVRLLSKAALFLDIQRQTLVYFKEQKLEIPVRFTAADLKLVDDANVAALRAELESEVHADQKVSILADAIVSLVASQAAANRFVYLAQNIAELVRRVGEGYRLFASSFSYTKIRGEVEAAQADYLARIHKTFVDIQGQLLALPVATVVVATQLKTATGCGVETWSNLAVVVGAWLFAALLVASCVNQWFTLGAIAEDINRQKIKLSRDFTEISGQFLGGFSQLAGRLAWHQGAMVVIGIVAVGGAVFATVIYHSLTPINPFVSCLK